MAKFAAGLTVSGILGFLLLEALKILRGPSRGRESDAAGEARMIQEIHRGLARMEERIEALETILLEQYRKEDSR